MIKKDVKTATSAAQAEPSAAEIIDEDQDAPGKINRVLNQTLPVPTINQADRLIEMAISSNADVDRLDQLLELKERYEKLEARKSYTAAMASFKSEDLVIKKDKRVSFPHRDGAGETSYRHATLGNIIGIAVPLLAKYGLSHKWEMKREGNLIEVRCVITHRDGHSEETEWWPAPLDDSGKKNPIQQAASTVTYLERYTFLMLSGLAVEDQDDDGIEGGGQPEPEPEVEYISENESNTIHALITDNNLEMPIILGWLYKVKKIDCIEHIPLNLLATVTDKINTGIKQKEERKMEEENE